MLQAVNYGFWEDWQNPQKVTFDGPNKTILVNSGVTNLDVKIDVYSAWKEWVLSAEASNAGYEQALRAVGGDPTVDGNYLGTTFFLTNGWRLRTWEGDHRLTVVGNLYTDEGEPPFIPTILPHNILIEYQVSNLTSLVGTLANPPTSLEIAEEIWNTSASTQTDLETLGGVLRILGQIGRNRTVTNPSTGVMTVYAEDGVTPLLTAALWEDVAGSQAYRGQGADRRERLQ
jgi:hypothetical protein